MTEDQARQVLLLQALESAAGVPQWQPDDRRWATRQAVATVGEEATPEHFVVARAALALQRLLPRDPPAQRWLARRAWHPAWVALALLLGLMAGLAVDQLGPPQRVNLLAPAVWAVVAWNLLVYLAVLLPSPTPDARGWLSRWVLRGHEPVALLWARHAAPLTGARLALVLHAAAATLALGLVAGLYLRGLVLDYRAGWQSTFATVEQVQAVLRWLLAPASAVTGIAVPDVAPLRVAPGADATATAAPWIHLLAATLLLAVVLPRALLAWRAGLRAARLAQRFPLPLETPYFEALHPLMRPGLPPTVRLLWLRAAQGPALRLFDTVVEHEIGTPQTLLRSDEGDTLQLHPVPAGVHGALVPAAATPWWQALWPGGAVAKSPLARLREDTDAVLLLTRPGASEPAWLAALQRPLVTLVDSPEAEPPRLSANPQARADGWLAEGLLLNALDSALPGDPRLPRLRQAWVAQQRARLDAGTQVLADSLARIAATHQAVADEGFLARRAEADSARAALATALDAEWRVCEERLAALLGHVDLAIDLAADPASPAPTPAAQLRSRLGEGRAALMGGVVTGALAGLKADVLSGGMTMGAGFVAGGLLGALGAAGMAKGLNVVRGTDRSFAAWDAAALAPITHALLQRYLVLAHGLAPGVAGQRLAPALAAQQGALATLWRARERRFNNAGEFERLARALQPLLSQALLGALGGPVGTPAQRSTAPARVRA